MSDNIRDREPRSSGARCVVWARTAGKRARTFLPLRSPSERSPTDAFFISTQPARETRDCESFEAGRPVYVVEKAPATASMIVCLVDSLRTREKGAAAVSRSLGRAGAVHRTAAVLCSATWKRGGTLWGAEASSRAPAV